MPETQPRGEARPRPRLADAVRRWLNDPAVTGDMLAVLVALADHADALGVCWPSQGHLARRLGWSRQRVGRVVASLVGDGLLRTRQLYRRDRGCSVLEYAIVALAGDASPPVPGGQGGVTERVSGSRLQNEEPPQAGACAPMRAIVDVGWRPTPAAFERARASRPGLDLDTVLEKFRAYHDGRSVLHPDRSFQLWVLREREERHARPPAARPPAARPSAGHPSAGHPSAGHPSAGHPAAARSSTARHPAGWSRCGDGVAPGSASDSALLRFRLRREGALE